MCTGTFVYLDMTVVLVGIYCDNFYVVGGDGGVALGIIDRDCSNDQ